VRNKLKFFVPLILWILIIVFGVICMFVESYIKGVGFAAGFGAWF
jgi:hypothetical protein